MKNNDNASARLRALLLKYAEEYDREWREGIEWEEFKEAERLRKGREPSLDLDEDQEMFALAERKIRNDQLLKHFDGLPQIGRPASDQWYDDLLAECLNDAGRIGRKVRDLFFERAKERRGVDDPKNQFAQAMKRRSHSA